MPHQIDHKDHLKMQNDHAKWSKDHKAFKASLEKLLKHIGSSEKHAKDHAKEIKQHEAKSKSIMLLLKRKMLPLLKRKLSKRHTLNTQSFTRSLRLNMLNMKKCTKRLP